MAAQSSASAAPQSNSEENTSRLHIRSIKEMPSGHDAELATIFREMRRAADIPRERMAGRLATTIEIVDALESGAIFALPPWPELSRIVSAYTVMLGLDARPVLRRLEAQLSPDKGLAAVIPLKEAPTPAPAPVAQKPAPVTPAEAKPNGPPMPPSAASPSAAPESPPPESGPPPEVIAPPHPLREARAPEADAQLLPREESAGPEKSETEKPKKSTAGLFKRALNWLVLIGFIATLGSGVWYAAQHPRVVWTALDRLPEPIPRAVRSAWKFMRPLDNNAAGSQTTDPGSRKSDKLP